jgi:pimeloyl-ACP methyl ester carboxylesterase
MKNIYFGTQPSLIRKKMLNLASHFAHAVTPNLALKTSYKFLVNPFGRRYVDLKELAVDDEFDIETKLGRVHLYYFKGGPKHILISHGWADTTQSMKTIIKNLLVEGYSVWSIDHIGHGKSEGNVSHLLGYIEGLNKAIEFIEKDFGYVHSIIGHSAGALSSLNLDYHTLKNKKVVLLGLPIKFFDSMFKKMDQMGIAKRVLKTLLEDLGNKYQVDWRTLTAHHHTEKFGDNFLLIHCKDDDASSYTNLTEFLMSNDLGHMNLFTTEKLGHRKILRDTKVMDQIVGFLRE